MQNKLEEDTKEAKVIALTKKSNHPPQRPEKPFAEGILEIYALEYIDQLLTEHFK